MKGVLDLASFLGGSTRNLVQEASSLTMAFASFYATEYSLNRNFPISLACKPRDLTLDLVTEIIETCYLLKTTGTRSKFHRPLPPSPLKPILKAFFSENYRGESNNQIKGFRRRHYIVWSPVEAIAVLPVLEPVRRIRRCHQFLGHNIE